jgi:peptide/nickel transport system ATP-binding protein
MSPLLSLRNLRVSFPTRSGTFDAVRGVSFDLGRERLGVVGESGSGKSMTGRAILGLVRPPGRVSADRMELDGESILNLPERRMRQLRGARISMVMQDPKFSLNPVMTIGRQITEGYRLHSGQSAAAARQKALDMLEAVQIRDPERVFNAYPHEISGGMGQRVMIAMMLAPDPEILIADEPTSALDVSVRNEVLNIMDKLVRDRGMGLIFISHDLNLVGQFCDRVLIMYAGRVVEELPARELHNARHPYTRGLLDSLPRLDRPVGRSGISLSGSATRPTASMRSARPASASPAAKALASSANRARASRPSCGRSPG